MGVALGIVSTLLFVSIFLNMITFIAYSKLYEDTKVLKAKVGE